MGNHIIHGLGVTSGSTFLKAFLNLIFSVSFFAICIISSCKPKEPIGEEGSNRNNITANVVSFDIVGEQNNEKRTCVITPQTRFTNTKIGNKYWISYKDGNLYQSNRKLLLKNVQAIYGNDTFFAIQDDGSLWAWGNNEYGHVGDNTGINRDAPVKILDNVKDITVPVHGEVYAVKNDGAVYAWGGSRFTAQKSKAKFVPEIIDIDNVSHIYVNGDNVSAVTFSGDEYQLNSSRKKFYKVRDKGKKTLFARRQLIVSNSDIAIEQHDSQRGSFITKDGDLYSWGDVTGNGTNIPVPKDSPILVLQNVKQICSGNAGWVGSKTYRYALCTDGKLYTVDITKTFKYELVASNVYLLNTSDNNVYSGIVSYYTNDGCIYQYNYGGKPKRTATDVALPQIKIEYVDIIRFSQDGYIQDISNHFGISDVSVIIIAISIISVLIVLCIIFPAFRKVISIILGIIASIVIIAIFIYAIIFVIAIVIWLFSGGLGRSTKDMFQ